MGGKASTCRGRRGLCLLSGAVAALAVAAGGRDARANLIITPTWDPSVTNLANAAQVEAAVNYAIGQYEQRFPVPARTVNVQMNVVAASGTSTFGHSNYFLNSYSYGAIQAALIAANPADAADVSSADPVTGTHSWWVTTAQAKALGLRANSTTNTDGTFTFGVGNNFNYDTTNRAIPGEYDFVGVADHEIAEILGRVQGLGTNFGNGGGDYTAYDLFRYSAADTRGLTNGGGVYFSMDDGLSDLKDFNNQASRGGDASDWASGTNDAYNAFSNSGVVNDITAVDQTAMNALGYSSTPEPASAALVLAGAGLLLRRRPARSYQ